MLVQVFAHGCVDCGRVALSSESSCANSLSACALRILHKMSFGKAANFFFGRLLHPTVTLISCTGDDLCPVTAT